MRVAIISEVFLPKIDGVVHRTLNLIQQLRAAGDEIIVLCPQSDGSSACSVPVRRFRSFKFPSYPEYRIGLPDRRLAAILAEFRPEVLHYVNPLAFGFRCYDLLRSSGIHHPTVFSFHTLYGEFVKGYGLLKPLSSVVWWVMREYHNLADANLTVSSIMQRELTGRGFERVELWPPAVDVELFHPERKSDAMRARLSGDDPHKPLLLTVSRLAPEKNVMFLASVLRRFPEAHLTVVGDGPQRAELERAFRDLPARFIGYLKGEELAAAYASADAFVYSSETETMGNVVLEAMAAGCPVVVPRAGGIPDLVDHERTGLLYRPRDVDDAAECVRRTLTDADLRRELGTQAHATVGQWDWRHAIGRVREVYGEAIANHQPTRGSAVKHRMAKTILSSLVRGFGAVAKKAPPGPDTEAEATAQ